MTKDEALDLALEALEHMLEDAKQERLTVEYWNECVDAITTLTQALAAPVQEPDRVRECAQRLVEHADFRLGGVLSADSKAKDIPSKAVSQVKARHLASLRDALAATPPAAPVQEHLSELEKDAANLLFALHDAWPYVHQHCTIQSKKKFIQALIVKHGDFADLQPPAAQPAPVQEPEWKQIAEDLRFHGLTLVKTATGYVVLKLGAVQAQATPPAQRQWTDTDIDRLSVLAGFDPAHKVELGLVRSVVRTILRTENT